MLKLSNFVGFLPVVFAMWLILVVGKSDTKFVKENYQTILFLPIICIGIFGLYAASVVLYRTFTFNDCKEAAVELQKEIEESKTELKRLGFVFKESEK